MFKGIEKKENENLANHTTLHINSRARWFLLPKDELELEQAVYECKLCGIDFFILGGGSNILVSDEGYSGAIISMAKFDKIVLLEENKVKVGSGVNLFLLNAFCQKKGLSGLEWSFGIPASAGGATKMNAGAYGGEFCKLIKEIVVFDGVSIKRRKNISFSYRKGCLKKGEILISAILQFNAGESEEIREKQFEYLKKRKESQPYGEFSLGSVFKRGKDFFPAKIIDEMGLKGKKIGDMQISQKHAGFIVNNKNGKASDFLSLVKEIEESAKEKGYVFEREFVLLGFEE